MIVSFVSDQDYRGNGDFDQRVPLASGDREEADSDGEVPAFLRGLAHQFPVGLLRCSLHNWVNFENY